MGRVGAIGVVGFLLALLVAPFFLSFAIPDATADPSAAEVHSTSVTCKPFNLTDGGALLTRVTCGTGYRALEMETEDSTAAWICGRGATTSNYSSVCRKRCVGCMNGAAVSDDANMVVAGMYNLTCISGTADAGVLFAVTCGK